MEFKHNVDFCTPNRQLKKESESSDRGPPSPYHDFTYDERMKLALATYYGRLKVHEAGKGKNLRSLYVIPLQ